MLIQQLLPNKIRAIDIRQGRITEQRINDSVRRLLRQKYRLGQLKQTQKRASLTTETGGNLRLHTITQGNNHIQIIMINVWIHLQVALLTN